MCSGVIHKFNYFISQKSFKNVIIRLIVVLGESIFKASEHPTQLVVMMSAPVLFI